MTLADKYQTFLSRPVADALAANASIHYIPTLASIAGASAILKHLVAQEKQLKKKSEKFLHIIEAADSLCVETETTFQFLTGGGCILPQLDDNFLADKDATLPVIHCVQFDAAGQITQIRLSWDMASLLRSIDVIGSRGRNWPIRDGKDQARLIASSAAHKAAKALPENGNGLRSGRIGANGDPHSSLSLFTPREEFVREPLSENPVAPRETARPAPRDYHDLFAAGVQDESVLASSPVKEDAMPLKSGAGKHHQDNRLFDEPETTAQPIADRSIKTNPDKFNHFQFGDAAAPVSNAGKVNRFTSQWDFSDFATPQKAPTGIRDRNARQLAWTDDGMQTPGEPFHRARIPQPRPDQASHFELAESTPRAEKRSASINNTTGAQSKARGLYQDPIFGDAADARPAPEDKLPLNNITNNTNHRQTFNSHFDMTDASPTKDGASNENQRANMPDARKRAVKTMEASYDFLEPSSPVKQRGIKIAGNGQGTRSNAESGWWDF